MWQEGHHKQMIKKKDMGKIKVLVAGNIFPITKKRNKGKDDDLRHPLPPSAFLPPGPGGGLLAGEMRNKALELGDREGTLRLLLSEF